MNKILFVLLLNLVLLLWGISASSHWLFIVLFLTWIDMMFYSYLRIEERSLLFAFGVAFFVFLLGREFLEQYFHHACDDYFTDQVTFHTYLSMWLALISVWLAFAFFSFKAKKKMYTSQIERMLSGIYILRIRRYSRFVFYMTYPFAMICNGMIAFFVAKMGYYSYYTDFSGVLAASPILYLLSKIELITSASFCVFLATFPSKQEFRKPCIAYLFYIVLTLGSGQRSGFLLGLLILFIFVTFMQEIRPWENWFKKKYMFYAFLSVPMIAVFGALFNVWRFEGDWSNFNVIDSFVSFFYQQGVTSYIIKRAYEMEAAIPGGVLYCLEFLHSGIPARLLGIVVFNGNTIEHALYGNSFTHALGYTVLGKAYLNGAGTGSSYIAELYFDFGYIGVIIGSALYGWMFSLITRGLYSGIFTRSLLFIIISQLLWAPRAAYTAFLSFLLAPSTVAMLLFIFLMAYKGVPLLHFSHIKLQRHE